METEIIDFDNECKRIAYHIKNSEDDDFCIPYTETFIPEFMKKNEKILSESYIIKNIFPKLAEYLNTTIVSDSSLKENQCKMICKDFNLIIEYNCWFNRKEFEIEISGKFV